MNLITEKKRQEIIRKTIDFFANERDEEIGVIAAEKAIEHFMETVGTIAYNKGIEDSLNLLKDHVGNLELDLESLLKK